MSDPEPPGAAHHTINYIELPSSDLTATKAFYGAVFGWTFQDWGPNYVAFHGGGIDGGFEDASVDGAATPGHAGALVILYSDDLENTLEAVKRAGGAVYRDIYAFPGGRRFHFKDPSGNELAVWAS